MNFEHEANVFDVSSVYTLAFNPLLL